MMIELNEQEKDFFRASQNEPVFSEKSNYKTLRINGSISHSLDDCNEIFRLNNFLEAFGSYIIHDRCIDSLVSTISDIWEPPALYIGQSGGGWGADIKSKKTSDNPNKSTWLSRLQSHKTQYITSNEGYRYPNVWITLVVPPDMEEYGDSKPRWAKMMEATLQYQYFKYHKKDPKFNKEFDRKVNEESLRQIATQERKNSINLEDYMDGEMINA